MASVIKYLVFFIKLLLIIQLVQSHTYTVKVGIDSFVNVVDSKFLSFTVDPRFLFSSAEKYNGKDSVCMASLLAPAYLRIAGPSTSHMVFHNSTITFTDLNYNTQTSSEEYKTIDSEETGQKNDLLGLKKKYSSLISGLDSDEDLNKEVGLKNKRHSLSKGYFGLKKDKLFKKNKNDNERKELAISHSQWKLFVQWANATGFDIVFALNNEQKNEHGLWDPNSAMKILTLAEKANFSRIFWQLGYECSNQSMDEYLNDLETLQAIVESYTSQQWGAVGGDVTRCLQADSKSDFRDYLTLTDEIMDAVVLNGNSSAQELERMSEEDRLHLLKRLSTSSTPLWLTDGHPSLHSELLRAADWMTSAGYSARNGFAVYFRELIEQELYEPTLSFYMAYLYKNLVGEKVLNIDMEVSEAALFAHCTSQRHKPVPGAVTLFAANLDDEMARFAIKLSRREQGGNIMQYILGHDLSGNIIINGRTIYEGEIKPIVKRVRPYKTLLLNLPPKSFGFWVVANTNVEACREDEEQNLKKDSIEAIPITEDDITATGSVKTKRSMLSKDFEGSIKELSKETITKLGLLERVDTLNANLNEIKNYFDNKDGNKVLIRRKRELDDDIDMEDKRKSKKFLRNKFKNSDEPKPRLNFIRKLLGLNPRTNVTRHKDKVRKLNKIIARTKLNKRQLRKEHSREDNHLDNSIDDSKHIRKRRNVINEKESKREDYADNDIDVDSLKEMKLWKILHKIHRQIKDLPSDEEIAEATFTDSKDDDHLQKYKLSDDISELNLKENTNTGILKSTVDSVVTVLNDLNKNLNKFWTAITLLE